MKILADVAELADAQVSEACDGDIVEVQVLSSAPNLGRKAVKGRACDQARFFCRGFSASEGSRWELSGHL